MFRRKPLPTLETTFLTPDLGNLLMMRLAAFIQENKASIRSINESQAILELGGPSWGDRIFGRKFVPRVRVRLNFETIDAGTDACPNRRKRIGVCVTPRRRRSPHFDVMAAYVCRELRGYFAAV